jgi:hypothetical protein
MSNADENKAVGKSGQRKRKSEQRKKGGQQGSEPQQLEDARKQISAPVMPTESFPTDTSVTVASPTFPVVPADAVPVSVQTIANAYLDYTNKSLEQTWSFFGKLAAVCSLDKAFELQTEFAKQAYETFVAESQKIRELHSEFARQRAMHLEGFVVRMTETTLVLRATRN